MGKLTIVGTNMGKWKILSFFLATMFDVVMKTNGWISKGLVDFILFSKDYFKSTITQLSRVDGTVMMMMSDSSTIFSLSNITLRPKFST